MNYSLDANDAIHTLTQQRNAALDEIVRMGAIIKALERMLNAPVPATTPAEPE